MDESTFELLADQTLHSVGNAFDDVDPDVVDCELAGNVVTLTLPGGKRCIVNTQRPTRQIWLAANARAWHFGWNEEAKRWVDDRGQGDELFSTIAKIVRDAAGVEVAVV
jgi:CyaY protein